MTHPFAGELIESIPIALIRVLNPRQRNQSTHAQIVENIRVTGLKRPITVARRQDAPEPFKYDLVCGQGRLEAYQQLGHTAIPAMVISASREDGLVMSLIENVARRHRSPLEMMREIQALRERGHTVEKIASVIGYAPSWVHYVLNLIEHGEERLLASVASGVMPMAIAVTIATGTSKELQLALAEAYESGTLRGAQLTTVRRVIKLRERSKAVDSFAGPSPGGFGSRNWTPEALSKIYEQEANARRLTVKKAEVISHLIAFSVAAFRELLNDEDFVQLLKREDLCQIPECLISGASLEEAVL